MHAQDGADAVPDAFELIVDPPSASADGKGRRPLDHSQC